MLLKRTHNHASDKAQSFCRSLRGVRVCLTDELASYLSPQDITDVRRACAFMMRAHAGQRRASGEPYAIHPLQVALILAQRRLDAATIVTALLHDVLEDTDVAAQQLRGMFGADVESLVRGVSQLSRLHIPSERERDAENFRRFLLAISDDIRVLLVKLADRLHNMRTLHFLSEDRQRRIAAETMDVHARLAERMGLRDIADEMDDRALEVLESDAIAAIRQRLDDMRERDGGHIETIIKHIEAILHKHGLHGRVEGREKAIHSIWQKLQNKERAFEKLSDIFAFRVIVADAKACYETLGAIHQSHRMVHGQLKDYISSPKPNGYRSLHTVVLGAYHRPIEIQIRSEQMHHEAEHGLAAHHCYKSGWHHDVKKDWLDSLLHISEKSTDADDFLRHTRLEMYRDQVFCFTPRGDMKVLPQGGTALDFAYSLHSDVGAHAIGAKVNGYERPLGYALSNGDRVEIECGDDVIIHEGWEHMAHTGKARSHILQALRNRTRDEFTDLGKRLWVALVGDASYVPSADELLQMKADDMPSLFWSLGSGKISLGHVMSCVKTGRAMDVVSLDGLRLGVSLHYGDCCYGMDGEEEMLAILRQNYGLMLHRRDCDVRDKKEVVRVRWRGEEGERHHVQLQCSLLHRRGSLAAMSQVISKSHGNIMNITTLHHTAERFHIVLSLELRDFAHQNLIMKRLEDLDEVCAVSAILVRGA